MALGFRGGRRSRWDHHNWQRYGWGQHLEPTFFEFRVVLNSFVPVAKMRQQMLILKDQCLRCVVDYGNYYCTEFRRYYTATPPEVSCASTTPMASAC